MRGHAAPDHLVIRTLEGKDISEREAPLLQSTWGTYYSNPANHLLNGGPLPVSVGESRRVIAVTEAAERSARTGRVGTVDGE